jgi:hypothetical protein
MNNILTNYHKGVIKDCYNSMTNKEFIEDTIDYYCSDLNRIALFDDLPMYKINGKSCAIGRWIKPDHYCNDMENFNHVRLLLKMYPDCLMDEVKNISIEVLEIMQWIHDAVFKKHYSPEKNRLHAEFYLENCKFNI